jgi:NTE family protein
VLGGGASLGAIQVGMLQALSEHHSMPDLVAGTSAGSVNGAAFAIPVSGTFGPGRASSNAASLCGGRGLATTPRDPR